MSTIYEIPVKTIDGNETTLESYKGKTLLIVNVASKCGFTKQYGGLEALYQQYKAKGLVVLGFPCNQFARQEPGDEASIKQFCETKFHVTFPMFSKIDVNGDTTHPLYAYLKSHAKGILGSEGIKWNFTKFIVNPEGEVVKRLAPATTPEEIGKNIKL